MTDIFIKTKTQSTTNCKKGTDMEITEAIKEFVNEAYHDYTKNHYKHEKSPVYNCKRFMAMIITSIVVKLQHSDFDEEVMKEISTITSAFYMEVLEDMIKGYDKTKKKKSNKKGKIDFQTFMVLVLELGMGKTLAPETIEENFSKEEIQKFLVEKCGWDKNQNWTYNDVSDYIKWFFE